MTMIIDGTNGLTFNNATTQASAGQVLQVISSVSTTETSTSSTSFINTGALSATITPKFATSKIAIFIFSITTGTGIEYTTIARGATELSGNASGMVRNGVSANLTAPTSLAWVDSPATTSATTYYMQGKVSTGTGYWGSTSTMILMEIAA